MIGLWDGYIGGLVKFLHFFHGSVLFFSFFDESTIYLCFFKFFFQVPLSLSSVRIVLCVLLISCRYSPSAAFKGLALKGGYCHGPYHIPERVT